VMSTAPAAASSNATNCFPTWAGLQASAFSRLHPCVPPLFRRKSAAPDGDQVTRRVLERHPGEEFSAVDLAHGFRFSVVNQHIHAVPSRWDNPQLHRGSDGAKSIPHGVCAQ